MNHGGIQCGVEGGWRGRGMGGGPSLKGGSGLCNLALEARDLERLFQDAGRWELLGRISSDHVDMKQLGKRNGNREMS